MESEVLVRVDRVSKKFCRDLKRSLWYGLKDMTLEFFGAPGRHDLLREDEFWAVKDVSFELRRGQCLGLIGHNGAGKSTLLKMLNGLIKPDQGTITLKGTIGALIELGAGFNPILTGRENIYVNGQILGFSKKEIDDKFDAIVDFAEVRDFIDMPVQNYSSGMKVRLGFAVAAQMEPDVLIVDEVLAVGDIGFRIKCMSAIHKILKNAAVILVSHSMQQISRVCNRGLMLNHGRVQLQTSDIGVLTESYLKHYSIGGQNRSGVGRSRIAEVKVFDEDNLVTESIPYGHPIRIRFKLIVEDPITHFSVRILIFNLENRPIFDYYSKHSIDHFVVGEQKEIRVLCVTPRTTLNVGNYAVSIIIIDEDSKAAICRVDNAVPFTIVSDYCSYAENFSEAQWEIS